MKEQGGCGRLAARSGRCLGLSTCEVCTPSTATFSCYVIMCVVNNIIIQLVTSHSTIYSTTRCTFFNNSHRPFNSSAARYNDR